MKLMNDGLKHRIIGAIILFALGVIFLPVFFQRDPIKPVDRETQIPPEPEIVTVEIEQPEIPPQMDLAPPPEEMYQPDETAVADPEPEPPGLNQQGVPKSWVLQIGSFNDAASAETLRAALTEQGFAAYTRELDVKGERVTRVLVGPKLDKSTLLQDKQKIDSNYRVDSILLEFKPK